MGFCDVDAVDSSIHVALGLGIELREYVTGTLCWSRACSEKNERVAPSAGGSEQISCCKTDW